MILNKDIKKPSDMPKLESPFTRKEINSTYICIPEINDKYRWVFTPESRAIEKLDGTNISIIIKDKTITSVYNRKNCIDIWKKGNKIYAYGLLESIDRGYISIKGNPDGQYFGELIGARINGNQYNQDNPVWLPFSYLKEKYRYKFWDDFVKELDGLPDKQIYEKVRNLFKGLWSLYKRKKAIKGEVTENTSFDGLAAEGIVFYKKGTNEMCKLRRDMFDFYISNRHNTTNSTHRG
ncbi:MAG: RNA ligase family protein [archaeon]